MPSTVIGPALAGKTPATQSAKIEKQYFNITTPEGQNSKGQHPENIPLSTNQSLKIDYWFFSGAWRLVSGIFFASILTQSLLHAEFGSHSTTPSSVPSTLPATYPGSIFRESSRLSLGRQ